MATMTNQQIINDQLKGTQTAEKNPEMVGAGGELTPIQQAVLDGITSGLKKSAHEAVSMGGPQVAEHALSSVGIDPQTGQNLIAQLVAMGTMKQPQEQKSQPVQPSNESTQSWTPKGNFLSRPTQVNPQTGEVLPAQILGGLISQNPQVTGQVLQNMLAGQKLAGQEPMQTGEYQKAALEVQQKIVEANKVPLNKEQQAHATASYNTAQIQLANDTQDKLQKQIDSNKAALETLIKDTPILNKAPGSQYWNQVQNYHKRIMQLSDEAAKHAVKMKNLKLKNPTASSQSGFTQQQRNAYNRARASGLSPEQARQKAGI